MKKTMTDTKTFATGNDPVAYISAAKPSKEDKKALKIWRESTSLGRRLLAKAPTLGMFLNLFNPDVSAAISVDPDQCLAGDYPTLTFVNKFYGKKSASVSWIIPHLVVLSEYAGVEKKLTEKQLHGCAQAISRVFYFLKVSELMLFFENFKNGVYGRFYGSVDPMAITDSLWTFVKWRNGRLSKIQATEVADQYHKDAWKWRNDHGIFTNKDLWIAYKKEHTV